MDDKMLEKAMGYYDWNRGLHSDFCSVIQDLIRRLLDRKKLHYNNISGRVKSRKSFIDKCKKEDYAQWNDITDIIGTRIITYLLKDVEAICALIESEFYVVKSKDKADELNNKEFGYIAKHYILRLSDSRASLSEYSRYKHLNFEVQVKTLTQHAWAEISHDRLYKSKSDEPPKDIERNFIELAAMLGNIDKQFQRISDDYDYYVDEVTTKIRRNDLNINISSIALARYGKHKFDTAKIHIDFGGKDAILINELKEFGITSLQDLDNIMPKDILEKINSTKDYSTNLTGLLRQIMIICDSIKYFEKCWGGVWPGTSGSKGRLYKAYDIDVDALKQKYLFEDKEISE